MVRSRNKFISPREVVAHVLALVLEVVLPHFNYVYIRKYFRTYTEGVMITVAVYLERNPRTNIVITYKTPIAKQGFIMLGGTVRDQPVEPLYFAYDNDNVIRGYVKRIRVERR